MEALEAAEAGDKQEGIRLLEGLEMLLVSSIEVVTTVEVFVVVGLVSLLEANDVSFGNLKSIRFRGC